jgi:opacity protein-like surface antigen
MSISLAKKFVLLVTFCTVSSGLWAQAFNPRFTLFSAGSIMKGERDFVVDGDQFRSEFVNGGKAGVRGTIDLTDHWSVDATYYFGTNNLRIREMDSSPDVRTFGIRQHQITTNLVRFLNGRDNRARLFVDGGLGLSRFVPTQEAIAAASTQFVDGAAAISSDNEFNFSFGGGVETRLTDHFGLRMGVRDMMAPVPRFGVPQTSTGPGGAFFPIEGLSHNIEVSIGTVFYLTGPR